MSTSGPMATMLSDVKAETIELKSSAGRPTFCRTVSGFP